MSKSKRITLSGITALGALLASGMIHAETGPLVAPTSLSPSACVASYQDNSKCPNWDAVPEKANPDAWKSDDRQTGIKHARWYSYGLPSEVVIGTNEIHFEFDQARILPQSYPVLNQIASTIKGASVKHVTVEGYTDSKGSDDYNLALSNRRAESVKEYLSNHAVQPSEISAVGKGESQPVAKNEVNGNDNPSGRDLNRRVEIHIQLAPGSKVTVRKGDSGPTYPESKG